MLRNIKVIDFILSVDRGNILTVTNCTSYSPISKMYIAGSTEIFQKIKAYINAFIDSHEECKNEYTYEDYLNILSAMHYPQFDDDFMENNSCDEMYTNVLTKVYKNAKPFIDLIKSFEDY